MFFESIMFLLSKITFFCGSIITGSSFPKPLPKDEEEMLIKKASLGEKWAKDKLITHNMRLVAHVVKKYSGAMEQDDLISIGSIGLVKAVNTFNPEKGKNLATFAARCIENEILMVLRSNKKHKNDLSLSDTVGSDTEGNELTLMDLLFEKEDSVFYEVDRSVEREKFLKFLKENLTKREYVVLNLRYGLNGDRNYAQREVAGFLKISRSYISRIENKAIEKLKKAVKNLHFDC